MKNNLIALAIFSLAVSFVIGCLILSNSLTKKATKPINVPKQHQLFTQQEAADYLGISTEEVQRLTEIPDGENSYTSEIPHIRIGETIYYPKLAIDKWLLDLQLVFVP
ncbi:DNA-binding protein [Neobacillus notoginsengisoli]|uniref:DNA-binding protein n=1 Tax=Neobacillus notoginsengisoli TaxID=1578198 RepID=A0A417YZE6_9BACI|nr:helix-turn-helix domain-containing protein [Neobacillus notoginsengisoli]RHW43289.1 DNA-binding protein [Neobacillus notoginsengisoli]